MRCWRLTSLLRSSTAFDGEGARRSGGRWNRVGIPAVYTSEHLPMAALEILVHVDPSDLTIKFVAIEIDIPDDALQPVLVDQLPPTWRDLPTPAASRAFGDAWLQAGSSLGLIIPSAVIPEYRNVILNPRHPAMGRMVEVRRMPFTFDPRLAGG